MLCWSLLYSQFTPPSPSPTVSTACSLLLHLYSCPANRFIQTIFLDSTYMHYHMIFGSLFLTYFTLYNRHICLRLPSICSSKLYFISSVQSLSRVWFFATPWIAARQASLSITNSRSSLRLTSIESVMPSSHLILCRPLLLLPPIPPSIRFSSNESTLCMRWPKYWSFSFSISPSNEHPGLISFRMD